MPPGSLVLSPGISARGLLLDRAFRKPLVDRKLVPVVFSRPPSMSPGLEFAAVQPAGSGRKNQALSTNARTLSSRAR